MIAPQLVAATAPVWQVAQQRFKFGSIAASTSASAPAAAVASASPASTATLQPDDDDDDADDESTPAPALSAKWSFATDLQMACVTLDVMRLMRNMCAVGGASVQASLAYSGRLVEVPATPYAPCTPTLHTHRPMVSIPSMQQICSLLGCMYLNDTEGGETWTEYVPRGARPPIPMMCATHASSTAREQNHHPPQARHAAGNWQRHCWP